MNQRGPFDPTPPPTALAVLGWIALTMALWAATVWVVLNVVGAIAVLAR